MQSIENKENDIVNVPADLRNYLESELNLEDYEKYDDEAHPTK
jgi:hypothetical protein